MAEVWLAGAKSPVALNAAEPKALLPITLLPLIIKAVTSEPL